MAYLQRQRITSKTALTGTPTWRYKLPNLGKYTALEMIVDCNRYQARADADLVYPIESQVTKIELLEGGGRALLSLTASQLDALNYWLLGHPSARRYSQKATGDNLLHLYILGGRNLYDQEYGFDFGKLAETYFEYTHTFATDTAEKFDVSTHTVYLYGWRWMGDGQPNFRGYFRARQLASWTTVAANVLKTIEIPTGNPYRIIALQAKTLGTSLGGTASKVELMVNNGEYSPVTISSLMQYCMQETAEYRLHNMIDGLDRIIGTEDVYLPPWFSYGGGLTVSENNYGTECELCCDPWSNPMRVRAQSAQNEDVAFQMSGYGFQKCVRIGFDHLPDGADLLQTRQMGALDLEVTEAAADKEAACFVQDIVSY